MVTFQGRLYWRGDDGYEQERIGPVFNGRKPNRYPAAILKAAHEQDVIAAVRLARERGLKISVRSGGHSWAAWSVRDDALLIDLASMREISLDMDTSIVRVNPAVTGGELSLREHRGDRCCDRRWSIGQGGRNAECGAAVGRTRRGSRLLRRRDPLPPQSSPAPTSNDAKYLRLSH